MDSLSRNVAMTAHVSGALTSFFLPSLGWLAPAFVWAINQKDKDVVMHAKEAFRFQFTMAAIAWLIGLLGAGLSCFLFGPILWLAALIPWMTSIAGGLMAAMAVNNRERFTYPMTGDPLVIR